MIIRRCIDGDLDDVFAIVNRAAEAYRGTIPNDCFHDPYMARSDLVSEIDDGVEFWAAEKTRSLVGVMGIQDRGEVVLIRHAYVLPSAQGSGIGGALLSHLTSQTTKPLLVGTWRAATWAIAFYQHHGFEPLPPEDVAATLRAYWTISDRQIETSIVLASAGY